MPGPSSDGAGLQVAVAEHEGGLCDAQLDWLIRLIPAYSGSIATRRKASGFDIGITEGCLSEAVLSLSCGT